MSLEAYTVFSSGILRNALTAQPVLTDPLLLTEGIVYAEFTRLCILYINISINWFIFYIEVIYIVW